MPAPPLNIASAFDPFPHGLRFHEYVGSKWEAEEALNLDALAALDAAAAILTETRERLLALSRRNGIGRAAGAISAVADGFEDIYGDHMRSEHGRQTEAAAWLRAGDGDARPEAVTRRLSQAEPFRSVEAAWFWCMQAVLARADGSGRVGSAPTSICEPEDIVKALDRLYRQRRLHLHHARILRIWGEKGVAPSPHISAERAEARVWTQAMAALETPLRHKGIVR